VPVANQCPNICGHFTLLQAKANRSTSFLLLVDDPIFAIVNRSAGMQDILGHCHLKFSGCIESFQSHFGIFDFLEISLLNIQLH